MFPYLKKKNEILIIKGNRIMEEKKNLKKKRKKMMEMEMVNEQINSNEKKNVFIRFICSELNFAWISIAKIFTINIYGFVVSIQFDRNEWSRLKTREQYHIHNR